MYLSRLVKLVLKHEEKLYKWESLTEKNISEEILTKVLIRSTGRKKCYIVNMTRLEKIGIYKDFTLWYKKRYYYYIFRRVNYSLWFINIPDTSYHDPMKKVERPSTLSDWKVILYNLNILKYVNYPISEDIIIWIYSEIVLNSSNYRQNLTIDQKLKNCKYFSETYDYKRFILHYKSLEINETLKKEVIDGIAKKIDILLTNVSRLYVKFIYFFKRK